MTICIAALANDGKAIVCAADKMLSFGDYAQWDSDTTKIIQIKNSECVGLIAGNVSHCAAVLGKLAIESDFGKDLVTTEAALKKAYEDTFSRFQDTTVLHRRGLTRELYHAIISSKKINRLVEKIADEMHDFSGSWSCDLIITGFDVSNEAFILAAMSPGNVIRQTTQGFHTIGIASEIAIARMLYSGYKRTHPFGRVLFDVFDAKANAELSAGVGFNWDAQIIFADGRATLPKSLKEDLIEAGWDDHNRSPFEKWNKEEYLPRPKRGWEDRILNLSRDKLEPV